MNNRCRHIAPVLYFLAGLILAGNAQAQLQLKALQVVDVTPSGFTLIGEVSEPAATRIILYADAAGTQVITNQLEVNPQPLYSGDPAETNEYHQDEAKTALNARLNARGLLQLRIENAQPATPYYYHVIAGNGSETTQWPTAAPAMVTTTIENAFISGSHQVLLTLNDPDPEGWLVTLRGNGASHPVSAVVGDGTAANQAYLNLSNLFGADGRNWQPDSNQALTLEVRRGWQSSVTEQINLPLTGPFSISTLHQVAIDLGSGPQLTLLTPAQKYYTTGQPIDISWIDEVPDVNAQIALYHDDNASGTDGALIVENLLEDPDDSGDRHSWNTSSMSDGIYYIYGTIDDGARTASSYAPSAIAIDRTGLDSDGDSLADLWERLFFNDLSQDGTGDADNDGQPDGGEFAGQTNPDVPDIRLVLQNGLNLVALPIDPVPALNSQQLAAKLGPNVTRISRLNPSTQTLEITEVIAGVPQGANFPIVAREGYFIDMAAERQQYLVGSVNAGGVDLAAGMNLAGFHYVPAGMNAYQLLQVIGTPDVITSIQRYSLDTGRYETAAYDNGQLVGTNFPIHRGEGYIFSMRQPASGIVLP